MTTTVRTAPAPTTTTKRVPMDPMRRTSLVAGLFYVITFVSIPTLVLYAPVFDNPDFIISSGTNTAVLWGGFLEMIVALAGIGTAVTLFPVVKRQNEAAALGFVTARAFEGAAILVGVVSILSVVTLRQQFAGAGGTDGAALVVAGQSLVAVYHWTFLLGDTLMPAINALLLGYLLYRSRLVPRILPVLGLIGGPLLLASTIAALFGIHEIGSVWSVIATAPIFVWELSLGIWLLVKGFSPASPILSTSVPPAPMHAPQPVA